MKRIFITLTAILATAVATFAADLSQVWDQVVVNKQFLVADVPAEKAAAEGFQSLAVALNSDPSVQDILNTQRLAATIEARQKITSVSQEGVDVSVYATPADAGATLYKVLMVVAATGKDKALIVLYGTCTAGEMSKAVQNMSLESIIGG